MRTVLPLGTALALSSLSVPQLCRTPPVVASSAVAEERTATRAPVPSSRNASMTALRTFSGMPASRTSV